MSKKMGQCSFCAMEIPYEAKKCPYCQESMPFIKHRLVKIGTSEYGESYDSRTGDLLSYSAKQQHEARLRESSGCLSVILAFAVLLLSV